MTVMTDCRRWEDDGLVADRVRSTLGPVVKRLDQPRVHVAGAHGTITLHGDVTSDVARRAIETAAARVDGVRRVESHLHTGLRPGDCTPSAGRRSLRSPLLRELERAARDCGFYPATESRYALRAVLGVFTARLPARVRARLLEHLPADVRGLSAPAHWLTRDIRLVSTARDLADTAAVALRTPAGTADRLLREVLPVLRRHVPGDADVVRDALPPELRALWLGAGASAPAASPATPDRHPWSLPVRAVMSRHVVEVPPWATLHEAYDAMTRAGVQHLPVIDEKGHCVALLDAVTVARRVPEIWASAYAPRVLPTPGRARPLSVLPDEPVARAAAAMHNRGVDACCVVDRAGRLVGLLTARDIVALVGRIRTTPSG